jgi:hypothetical protein
MAQATVMGPPLSPREPRRSGRRSAPSLPLAHEKSPDEDVPPPPPSSARSATKDRDKDREKSAAADRPPLSHATSNSSTTSGRAKKVKHEDMDDAASLSGERGPASASSGSTTKQPHAHSPTQSITTNGRGGKRGGKGGRRGQHHHPQPVQNEPHPSDDQPDAGDGPPPAIDGDSATNADEGEEEQGVTRCICQGLGPIPFMANLGLTLPPNSGQDDDDIEFMVQCEACQVWQHGMCMGYESADQLNRVLDNYFCEECRPDMHPDILKSVIFCNLSLSNVSYLPYLQEDDPQKDPPVIRKLTP